MEQARNGDRILGLAGKRCVDVLAVPPENADSGRGVNGRFPQLLDLYTRNHYVEGSTPATVTFYRKEVGLFVKFLENQGHSLWPGDVFREDVQDHLFDLRERGRKPRTIRSRRHAILTFFTWAKEWEKVDESTQDTQAVIETAVLPQTD